MADSHKKGVRRFLRKRQALIILSLLVVVPVGFYSKFYAGPAASWVNNSLSGVFYEVFWCLLVALFFNDSRPWKIAIFVLTATCILEFLQLWHPAFLEFLRGFFLGRTILGDSFCWSDFSYYFIGTSIGWVWMTWIQKTS